MIDLANYHPSTRPIWIACDSIDGAGKTTLVEKLLNHFKNSNRRFTKVSMFPQCGLRDFILNEGANSQFQEALVTRALHEQAYSVINKLLESGSSVITDRGPISALAYQGYGNKNIELIEAINNIQKPLVEPDLTIFIDVNPKICKERIQARGIKEDLMESRAAEFTSRVYNGFKFLLAKDKLEHLFNYIPNRKILSIDGRNSPDEVFNETLEILNERFQIRN